MPVNKQRPSLLHLPTLLRIHSDAYPAGDAAEYCSDGQHEAHDKGEQPALDEAHDHAEHERHDPCHGQADLAPNAHLKLRHVPESSGD